MVIERGWKGVPRGGNVFFAGRIRTKLIDYCNVQELLNNRLPDKNETAFRKTVWVKDAELRNVKAGEENRT